MKIRPVLFPNLALIVLLHIYPHNRGKLRCIFVWYNQSCGLIRLSELNFKNSLKVYVYTFVCLMNQCKLVNFFFFWVWWIAVHTGLLLVLLSSAKGLGFHLYFNLDLPSSRSDPSTQVDRLTAIGTVCWIKVGTQICRSGINETWQMIVCLCLSVQVGLELSHHKALF